MSNQKSLRQIYFEENPKFRGKYLDKYIFIEKPVAIEGIIEQGDKFIVYRLTRKKDHNSSNSVEAEGPKTVKVRAYTNGLVLEDETDDRILVNFNANTTPPNIILLKPKSFSHRHSSFRSKNEESQNRLDAYDEAAVNPENARTLSGGKYKKKTKKTKKTKKRKSRKSRKSKTHKKYK